MSTSNIDGSPLPVIPEHLRPYLVTPAAYLEQHKSEGVTHLVVGAKRDQQSKKILLVQRSRHDYGGLCWEIPGGSCDPHDVSILDAAARELAEEAGLRVRRFVAVVDRQRHEWLDRGEIWRKLTFIVEAESEHEANDEYGEISGGERDEETNEQRSQLQIRLDPEEHEDFVWASREDLVAGGIGQRTFTWMQDEQRQVIMRAFDIIEHL
ncbi:uncharacterized protein PG986_008885 [Apiospora aurea]|uniref:Nudix hydrolase domain-containing protein n=1 Tax=Apiospora aurea TaxID=335848 RepID=A0ABR1Q6H4_9PEZI